MFLVVILISCCIIIIIIIASVLGYLYISRRELTKPEEWLLFDDKMFEGTYLNHLNGTLNNCKNECFKNSKCSGIAYMKDTGLCYTFSEPYKKVEKTDYKISPLDMPNNGLIRNPKYDSNTFSPGNKESMDIEDPAMFVDDNAVGKIKLRPVSRKNTLNGFFKTRTETSNTLLLPF